MSTTTTTTTATTPSPSSLHLSGLGMWYGAHTFRQQDWDRACIQARAWGMSIVHPKLADGPNLWYDGPGLAMIKQVADAHSLRVVPYHFCYGNTVGSSVEKEAAICALLGNIYGGVSPDMEDQWFHQEAWASLFGKVVRANFSGGVFPTIYANVATKPEPYIQFSSWVNGFLPQCYFSGWTSLTRPGHQMTAQEAINFLAPQWGTLSGQVTAALGKPLPALYPLLSVGNSLPPEEVVSWLSRMGGYHYCGFWYDVPYGPYASSVLQHLRSVASWPTPPPPPPHAPAPAPMPVVVVHPVAAPPPPPVVVNAPAAAPPPPSSPAPVPPMPPSPQVPASPPGTTTTITTPSPNGASSGEHAPFVAPETPPFHVPQDGPVLSYPHIDEMTAHALWQMHRSDMAWAPTSAIQTTWLALLVYHPDIWLGSPIEQEMSGESIGGEEMTWITFESGRRIVYFPRTGSTILF